MIDLEKTALHRVYKTELLGDALVVTLQGDSPGFSVGAVQNEMSTLIGIAKSPDVRNLIIDMSGSNYYGSLILGEIVNLGQAVREQGGRIALAGISDDMKEILRMMRLDGMWERYPTRAMALRALANITWRDRLRPSAKPAAIAGGAFLLIALYFVIPRYDPTPEYYRSAAAIWKEAQEKHAAMLDESEWQFFRARAVQKLDELTRQLSRTSGNDAAARTLLFAVRDYAPKALEQRLDPKSDETILTDYYLALVRSTLEKTDPPPKPKILQEAEDADDGSPGKKRKK